MVSTGSHVRLNSIAPGGQDKVEICNSPLNEYAVLGFEYGASVAFQARGPFFLGFFLGSFLLPFSAHGSVFRTEVGRAQLRRRVATCRIPRSASGKRSLGTLATTPK
jgi:uncharacterized membrane protein